MLLELVGRDREALHELARRDRSLAVLAARGQQVGEQRLQHAEALGRDRAGEPLAGALRFALLHERRRSRRRALVRGARGPGALDAEAAQLGRLERDRATVLAEDPAGEQVRRGVLGREDVAVDAVALAAVGALDPPGGVRRDLDRGAADDVAELPVGAAAVVLDVELGRQPEVTLATGGEADVGADARDAERADVVAVEVVADHVPRAVLGQQRVGVERALALLVAGDRPVAELDRALLRDRAFELAEATLQLGRVVGVAHLDPAGGAGRRGGERAGRAAEREVLQREAQRLGVREAALEQEEAGLEGGELFVVELELRQEVALGAERVELLAGELVALRVERHAERRRAPRGPSRTGARTPRRSSPDSPRRST